MFREMQQGMEVEMFEFEKGKLEALKAVHTVSEIRQQGKLWKEVYRSYLERKESMEAFFREIHAKHKKIRVIFTGAGTSEYVGNMVLPKLLTQQNESISFESIATTALVSNPRVYLWDTPTLLVSFARSGNSPESLAAVELVNQICKDAYHLAITCAKDGALAKGLSDRQNAYVNLMPDASNDKGFAMTGSCSCMTLSALLIFDQSTDTKKKGEIVTTLSEMADAVLDREDEIAKVLEADFDRIVYIGSGVFAKLSQEAALKILELTAGKIASCTDSSMGFRHGPKSFINDQTLVFDFVSTDPYTRRYDVDVVREIYGDRIAKAVVAITKDDLNEEFQEFSFGVKEDLEDAYLTLPYLVYAQMVSVLASVKVHNTPDTPSASGTVNRVVKGVIIHELV